ADRQADLLLAGLTTRAGRAAVDLYGRVEVLRRGRPGDQHDRPRRMALGEACEHVLRRLLPGLGDPRDVRHHARALDRLAGGRLDPLGAELALDVPDRS